MLPDECESITHQWKNFKTTHDVTWKNIHHGSVHSYVFIFISLLHGSYVKTPTLLHSHTDSRTQIVVYSLRCFDQQLADEVHSELRHPGEGLPAVVHIDLGNIQIRLLLVVPSKRRLARHQHVRDDAHAPEKHTQDISDMESLKAK